MAVLSAWPKPSSAAPAPPLVVGATEGFSTSGLILGRLSDGVRIEMEEMSTVVLLWFAWRDRLGQVGDTCGGRPPCGLAADVQRSLRHALGDVDDSDIRLVRPAGR